MAYRLCLFCWRNQKPRLSHPDNREHFPCDNNAIIRSVHILVWQFVLLYCIFILSHDWDDAGLQWTEDDARNVVELTDTGGLVQIFVATFAHTLVRADGVDAVHVRAASVLLVSALVDVCKHTYEGGREKGSRLRTLTGQSDTHAHACTHTHTLNLLPFWYCR